MQTSLYPDTSPLAKLQLVSQPGSASTPVSPTFSCTATAGVADSSSDDDVLQLVAQSVRRTRRPLLLESDSDGSPDASTAAQYTSSQLGYNVPTQQLKHAGSSQQGVQVREVVIIDSDDEGHKALSRNVFELSPSPRQALATQCRTQPYLPTHWLVCLTHINVHTILHRMCRATPV